MSSLGTLAPVDYSSREYWEHRYVRSLSGEVEDERGPTFEWLAKPQEMGAWLGRLPRDGVALELGCGNSTLCEQLAAEGFEAVLAVDFSPRVCDAGMGRIQSGEAPPACRSRLEYAIADGMRLPFRSSYFRSVLDKGYVDSVLNAYDQQQWWVRCGSKGVCKFDGVAAERDAIQMIREPQVERRIQRLPIQVARVLDHRPGSVAIFVSYEPPAGRLPFLQSDEWQWTVEAEEDEQGNYVYFCTRV